MLRAAIDIQENHFLFSKNMSSCDISVEDDDLMSFDSALSREKCDPNLRECISAAYEYYSGREKNENDDLYRKGPETLRRHFVGGALRSIKSHPWTDEGARLVDAVHWCEKLSFEEVKGKGAVSLSYALLNSCSVESASRCLRILVTRNTAYEWWNEYRIWKKYGDREKDGFLLRDPGTQEEFRERFLEAATDAEGKPKLSRVLREENDKLVEKYIYAEEAFFVEKKLQFPLVLALYELCNFVPRIVSKSKRWINSSPEERESLIAEEARYFEEIKEMSENMHVAHKLAKSPNPVATSEEVAAATAKKTNRVSPFAKFCREKHGGDDYDEEKKKTYGREWRKMSDDAKKKYGVAESRHEKKKRKKESEETNDEEEEEEVEERDRGLDARQRDAASPPPPNPPNPPKARKKDHPATTAEDPLSPPPPASTVAGGRGVLVGRSIENVAEELDTYFNSNLFQDEQKKFVWNMFYANARAGAMKGKITLFDETCLKPAYEAYLENPDAKRVALLKHVSSEDNSNVKNLVQLFNTLFSRGEAAQEEKEDFIF